MSTVRVSTGASGIYEIRDARGRSYIGSSIDIPARWKQHKRDLERGRHHSYRLQASWKKHGPDFFEFRVLQIVGDPGDLLMFEQFWIDFASPVYNVSRGAGRPQPSEKTKKRRERARITREVLRDVCWHNRVERAKDRCKWLRLVLRAAAYLEPERVHESAVTKYESLYARAMKGRDPWDVIADPFLGKEEAMITLSEQPWVDKVLQICENSLQKHRRDLYTQ